MEFFGDRKSPSDHNFKIPDKEQKFGVPENQQKISPEKAQKELFLIMDALENKHQIQNKAELLQAITNYLRIIAETKDPQAHKKFKEEPRFKKLNISSKYTIQNLSDRDLHKKIITYFASTNNETTAQEHQEIVQFFEKSDSHNKEKVLESYAQHGLLTLSSALKRGVLKETSSTPGDFGSIDDTHQVSHEEINTVRGYELDAQHINDSFFYGRNSFFQVALERGGEKIDRAGELPKQEVENRLKNSMVFVVDSEKLHISRRTENQHKEDIVRKDIPPEEIDYLLVDESNSSLAKKIFGHLPIKIIAVDTTKTSLEGLYEENYTLPNYKKAVEDILESKKSIWCHIARLPVDTYPR